MWRGAGVKTIAEYTKIQKSTIAVNKQEQHSAH